MKTYKHKLTGNIATETSSEKNYKVTMPQNFTVPKWIIENSCDWEEVLPDVPEYVKCVYWGGYSHTTGKIYKMLNNYIECDSVPIGTYPMPSATWYRKDDGHFIPSTKEEYDAQFKEYEILKLSAKANNGYHPEGTIINFYFSQSIDKDWMNYWNIHSVKRLSDGEIFTVGDKINGCGIVTGTIIREFMPCWDTGKLYVNTIYGNSKLLEIAPSKIPLFITEDNVPIYEGDEYWYVLKDRNTDWSFAVLTCKADEDSGKNSKMIFFSTKKAAEDYIAKNKVLFVTEDGVGIKANDKYWAVSNRFTMSWYPYIGSKEKGQEIYYENNKTFSTKEKAQEYIDNNKPMYSKKQIRALLDDWTWGEDAISNVFCKLNKL